MSAATVPAQPDRRTLIAQRQKDSVVWRTVHLLGSLHLALILLATIALACAIATFTESGFSTKVAQTYIYKAPWFVVWLGVLCVNLLAVTITRWPWQKKHTGFIITHYGIITLLIGAIIGLHSGFEGNVTIHRDGPPVSRIVTRHSILQVQSPVENALYTIPFDPGATRPTRNHPRRFPVPGAKLQIVANGFSPNMVHEPVLRASEDPGAGPGVALQFASGMMGQSVHLALAVSGGPFATEDFFGLARIVLYPEMPAAPVDPELEIQVVFANSAPVIQARGKPSGLAVRLSADGSRVAISGPDGAGGVHPRGEIMGRSFVEAGVEVLVEHYWPDFAMEAGKPVTKSSEPNNPAILVRLVPVPAGARPELVVAPSGNGIAYRLLRNDRAYASGSAKSGDSISLGWADWRVTVTNILPRAQVADELKPGPDFPVGREGIPGVLAHLEGPDGKPGPDLWLESGQVVTLTSGSDAVVTGFGLETRPVPFSIRLVDFEVPRDEGTDSPSDFRATVEFRDAATGATRTGLARMNHTASFPGTLWASITGLNYKFSQAEWNPRDLGETTLQVLYDPGWLLKWIGSIGICAGIVIMFYFKPKSH